MPEAGYSSLRRRRENPGGLGICVPDTRQQAWIFCLMDASIETSNFRAITTTKRCFNLTIRFNTVKYLPQSGHGLVLFTTRSRKVVVEVATNNVVDLREMSSEDAASIFRAHLPDKNTMGTEEVVKELVKDLNISPSCHRTGRSMHKQEHDSLLPAQKPEADLEEALSQRTFGDNIRWNTLEYYLAAAYYELGQHRDAVEILEAVLATQELAVTDLRAQQIMIGIELMRTERGHQAEFAGRPPV
ncbi:hypothetical protein F4811DRAFT_570477 [Daldinia bambusicola]|nr:hypothetical protein F4811DRAFT_570477 [Daldinia bambusicola]